MFVLVFATPYDPTTHLQESPSRIPKKSQKGPERVFWVVSHDMGLGVHLTPIPTLLDVPVDISFLSRLTKATPTKLIVPSSPLSIPKHAEYRVVTGSLQTTMTMTEDRPTSVTKATAKTIFFGIFFQHVCLLGHCLYPITLSKLCPFQIWGDQGLKCCETKGHSSEQSPDHCPDRVCLQLRKADTHPDTLAFLARTPTRKWLPVCP